MPLLPIVLRAWWGVHKYISRPSGMSYVLVRRRRIRPPQRPQRKGAPLSGLAATLAETKNPRRGGACSVTQILNRLDDTDSKALRNALEGDLEGETIAAVLRGDGHPISGYTVQRHRNGRCNCE